MKEDVAIVIVTYNAERQIRPCLNSLRDESLLSNTFIVDNLSADGTVSVIRNEYSGVHLVQLSRNVGFGKGNNVGISRALQCGYSCVFLLNQDAMVFPGCLDSLCSAATLNPGYGVLSPLHYGAESGILESDFRCFVRSSKLFDDALAFSVKDVYPVSFVNAAAWLITEECLSMVGGFSPNFFLYGEDIDYCNRLEFYGLRVGVVPGSKIKHLREGNPLSYASPFSFRNRSRRSEQEFMWHLINPSEKIWRAAYALLVDIGAALMWGVVSHTLRIAVADLCAWFRCLRRIPELKAIRGKNISKSKYLWLLDNAVTAETSDFA